MNEECLICKAPLEYMETDTMMECVICHKKEKLGVEMELGKITCSRSKLNNQCIEERCTFYVKN